jgi:hypothetical protein
MARETLPCSDESLQRAEDSLVRCLEALDQRGG